MMNQQIRNTAALRGSQRLRPGVLARACHLRVPGVKRCPRRVAPAGSLDSAPSGGGGKDQLWQEPKPLQSNDFGCNYAELMNFYPKFYLKVSVDDIHACPHHGLFPGETRTDDNPVVRGTRATAFAP